MKSPLLSYAIEHLQFKQFIFDDMAILDLQNENINFSNFFKLIPKILKKN